MEKTDGIGIVRNGRTASIYVDSKGKDYEGLKLVAQSFAKDLYLVTGKTPAVTDDVRCLDGTVIIAGSVGNNDLIDEMVGKGKIDVSPIKSKWESFMIRVVENPIEGVDRAIAVVGSDKRGTIYGIYHISELIGVSPWVYWGDVIPERKSQLVIPENKLNFTSKEPTIKYRGIFLNDEWPSLGIWTTRKFGSFNENFYEQVFQLILRLKGNFLWPAMWHSIFSEDGKSCRIANARLADAYGIVMSTSHHEPLFRAGEEWQKVYKQYGISNEWNFANNKEAISRFWEDGVLRNKDYENVVTLGMRGECDSSLGGGIRENIDLLKRIITVQKGLLKKYGIADVPQVLTLYKEVEGFWYGKDTVEGLKNWDVLNDVTIMLCEDNFGNMRTLPKPEERERKAGWGMYYHFDYHGGPTSYEWVNTTPLQKVWEQMTMAYEYGIRDIWIVNVGDLKPMELPVSYFLDLAYDFDTWGTNGLNRTKEYTQKWVRQQFGNAADDKTINGIVDVISDYTRMNGIRKPETLAFDTFSTTYGSEAQRVMAKAITIENNAKKYYNLIPDALKDAYYQLVLYPAAASANVVKMHIYAGLNQKYYRLGSILANKYAQLVKETIQIDEQMQRYYNDTMSGGKWRGMMSSPHIGYITWDSVGWHYPEVNLISPEAMPGLIVDVAGSERGYTSGTAVLPAFTNLGKEVYSITISNGGTSEFDYSVEVSDQWIKVDSRQGRIYDGETIKISADWDKILKSTKGIIKISGAERTVSVNVVADIIDTSGLDPMTFVETNNVVSIEAEHTSERVSKSGTQWKVIKEYGRTLSSIKMFPTTVSFERTDDAPYLEYRIYVRGDGDYTLTTYVAPTNNLFNESRLRYGVSFDGLAPVIADTIPEGFETGNDKSTWRCGVLDNARITSTSHALTEGTHVLRFYSLDAGLVLQKLVLSKGPLPISYFGPEESWYKRRG